jgi:hypothetical protein
MERTGTSRSCIRRPLIKRRSGSWSLAAADFAVADLGLVIEPCTKPGPPSSRRQFSASSVRDGRSVPAVGQWRSHDQRSRACCWTVSVKDDRASVSLTLARTASEPRPLLTFTTTGVPPRRWSRRWPSSR